jgi:hypothetical protein
MMTEGDTDPLSSIACLIGIPLSCSVVCVRGRNGIVTRVWCPSSADRLPGANEVM